MPFRIGSRDERAKLVTFCRDYGVDYFVSGHVHDFWSARIQETEYIICGIMNNKREGGTPAGYLLFTYNNGALTWQFATQ